MRSDEQAIRELHSTWIDAVNAGDLARLLSLMADDVVFLNPGDRASARMGFPPSSLPLISSFGSAASASWKRSWSPARLPTRGAVTHYPCPRSLAERRIGLPVIV